MYLDYLQKEGVLRAEPLIPADNPLETADRLIASAAWKDIRFKGDEPGHKWFLDDGWVMASVREQALNALGACYKHTESIRCQYSYTHKYPWDQHLAAVRLLKTRWDRTEQRYVRADQ